MPKTVFTSGIRVAADWFRAMQTIIFDDADIDGHYPRLTDDALSNTSGNIKPEFYTMRDALRVLTVSGLTIRVKSGFVALQNGTQVVINETQFTLPDDTTRFVYVNNSGALEVGASVPSTGILLARVVTSGGAITSISDLRERVGFQVSPITVETSTAFVMPSGAITAFAGSAAPTGWLFCDGSVVLRSQYPALFAAIGTAYGVTDASSFKLPDFRDRSIVGKSSTNTLGDTGGSATVTLTQANLPIHNHGINDPGHSHSISDPGHVHGFNDPGHSHTTNLDMGGSDGQGIGTTATNTTASKDFTNTMGSNVAGTNASIVLAGSNISINGSGTGITTQAVGSNTPFDNRSPFGVANYIIKA